MSRELRITCVRIQRLGSRHWCRARVRIYPRSYITEGLAYGVRYSWFLDWECDYFQLADCVWVFFQQRGMLAISQILELNAMVC